MSGYWMVPCLMDNGGVDGGAGTGMRTDGGTTRTRKSMRSTVCFVVWNFNHWLLTEERARKYILPNDEVRKTSKF
jgi:hypothetical protein